MTDKKISQLTGATTPLAGTEVLPIVQSGATVKVSAADLTAGRSISTAGGSLDGAVTINDSGADVDFRVESDTNTHALFVDGGNSRVGVNTSAPKSDFDVNGLLINKINEEDFDTTLNQFEDFELCRFTGGTANAKNYIFTGMLSLQISLTRGTSTDIQNNNFANYFISFGALRDSSATSRGVADVAVMASNVITYGASPGSTTIAIVVEQSNDNGATWAVLDDAGTESTGNTVAAIYRIRANLSGSTPNNFNGNFRVAYSLQGMVTGLTSFELTSSDIQII